MNKKKMKMPKVAVLFSGGADSSLSAIRMGERYNSVHLLQYHHRYNTYNSLRSLRSVEIIEELLGPRRVFHRMLNMRPTFAVVYMDKLTKRIRDNGTLAISMICGVCKLIMHLLTIRYCLVNRINCVADGASKHQNNLFPAQTKVVMEYYRDIYTRFGIDYYNPVYEVERSEDLLEQMGLSHWHERKREHLFYSSQPSCYLGLITYLYTYGFQLPIFGCHSRIRSMNQEAVPFLRIIEEELMKVLNINVKD